jgi:hypothetical protein
LSISISIWIGGCWMRATGSMRLALTGRSLEGQHAKDSLILVRVSNR